MRPQLVFDGKGINGPDEYRTRVATFQTDADATKYGSLLAASPDLLRTLKQLVEASNTDEPDPLMMFACIEQAKGAIDKAEGKA